MKKSTTRTTFVFLFLIMLIVGYFAYLSNRDRSRDEQSSLTAVEKVLSRDLQLSYPPTPKEVILYYNDIIKCLYNEECSDEELEKLGDKARELYDEELLANNERVEYMTRLKADVKDYKEHKRKITNFAVSASTDVQQYTLDGYDFARLLGAYNIVEGKKNTTVNEVYLLRRDEDKHWKIYGWDLASNLQNNRE